MKRIVIFIALILVINSPVKAQVNPDGNQPSIHFTPYTQTGTGTGEFCFQVSLKIPLYDSFTITPFYESFTIDMTTLSNNIITIGGPLKQTKYGATFSFYFD